MSIKNFNDLAWFATLVFASLSFGGCTNVPAWMLLQRKAAVTDFQHFDNAPISRAEKTWELPIAGEAQLHLPQQLNGEAFLDALEHSGTTGFVVIQHGKISMERYFNGATRDSVMPSFSAAKSIVGTLFGIALSEGKINSVDDSVTRYLPELEQNDVRFTQIKLRHLLEMRSGIKFEEEYETPWDDAAEFYLADNLAAQVQKLAIERNPDETFHYSSGDSQLLGLVIQRATGMSLPGYLQEKLWQPMGSAYDASWSLDSTEQGNAKAFCCFNARALDYARFGQLILREGKVGDKQIVPVDWIRQSTSVREHPGLDIASRWNLESPGKRKAAFYTWHWRRFAVRDDRAELGIRPSSDIYAEGLLGQYVYIAPKADLVIVRLGKRNGKTRWPAVFHEIALLNGNNGALITNNDRPGDNAAH